jgi:xylan 1,4-beta-xylosidase
MFPYLLLAFLSAGAGFRPVEVDAARATGQVRSFQGVVSGPLVAPGGPDFSKQYKELHLDFIRADGLFGPLDIDARWSDPDGIATAKGATAAKTIFPNWSADPERPESYNFAPTDPFVQSMADSGAEVCYRIGRSWSADPQPPPDFDKYANIVKHVAMHYNAGWAHGFHDHIRYWEFWNEPDDQRSWNPQFVRPFWTGTPAQFYSLYEKVARALKSFDPQLKIGGPAKAVADLPGPYREGFIRYCAGHGLPLDFYSWHDYFGRSYDPFEVVRVAQIYRQLLDTNGFRNAEILVTEWNMGQGLAVMRGANGSAMNNAAFVDAALIYLQDSVIGRAAYYRGEAGPRKLVEDDGRFTKYGYAFLAGAAMLDTPQRLSVAGADTIGFAVLAGRSADGGKVRILISNYEIPPQFRSPARGGPRLPRQTGIVYGNNRGYALHIANLPWGNAAFSVKRYRLSDTDNFSPQTLPPGHGSSFALTQELAPPAVELIELERRD